MNEEAVFDLIEICRAAMEKYSKVITEEYGFTKDQIKDVKKWLPVQKKILTDIKSNGLRRIPVDEDKHEEFKEAFISGERFVQELYNTLHLALSTWKLVVSDQIAMPTDMNLLVHSLTYAKSASPDDLPRPEGYPQVCCLHGHKWGTGNCDCRGQVRIRSETAAKKKADEAFKKAQREFYNPPQEVLDKERKRIEEMRQRRAEERKALEEANERDADRQEADNIRKDAERRKRDDVNG